MARPAAPFPVCLALACALGAPGCVRTPQSICQEYVDAINAMFMRCELPYTYNVVRDDGMQGCHLVQRIDNPRPILDQCIPWSRSVACEEIDRSDPIASFPPYCGASYFSYSR